MSSSILLPALFVLGAAAADTGLAANSTRGLRGATPARLLQEGPTLPETECTCISVHGVPATCEDHFQQGLDPWCYVSELAQCSPAKILALVSREYYIDCGKVEEAISTNMPPVCYDNPEFTDAYGYKCIDWADHSCTSHPLYSDSQLKEVKENCPQSCKECGDVVGTGAERVVAEQAVVMIEMSILAYNLTSCNTESCGEENVKEASALNDIINDAGYQSDDITCYKQGGSVLLGTYTPGICVWVKDSPRQAVIAVRGTDSLTDLLKDIKSIFGGIAPDAARVFLGERVTELRSQGYDVLITGHSLGGYLAEIASSYMSVPGIAFDAPGPDGDDRFTNLSPTSEQQHTGWNGNRDFHVLNAEPLFGSFLTSESDPLGNLGWPYFSHYTPPIWLTGLRSHSSAELLETFKALLNFKEITNVNIMEKVAPCGPVFHQQALCNGGISCGLQSFWLPAAPSVPSCPVEQ